MANLKRFFDNTPLTLEEIAEACDVSVTSVKEWKNGTKEPSKKHRKDLFKILQISPNTKLGEYYSDAYEQIIEHKNFPSFLFHQKDISWLRQLNLTEEDYLPENLLALSKILINNITDVNTNFYIPTFDQLLELFYLVQNNKFNSNKFIEDHNLLYNKNIPINNWLFDGQEINEWIHYVIDIEQGNESNEGKIIELTQKGFEFYNFVKNFSDFYKNFEES